MWTPPDLTSTEDAFANLRISDEAAIVTFQEPELSISTLSYATYVSRIGENDSKPWRAEMDNAWRTLYASFKITANGRCPVPEHKDIQWCTCPTALGQLTTIEDYWTKVHGFIRWWDLNTIHPSHGMFEYDGSYAGFNIFAAKHSTSPSDYAKKFAEGNAYMFGPSGTMEDWANSLVDFCIKREAMLKSMHLTSLEDRQKWVGKEYEFPDILTGVDGLIFIDEKGDLLEPHEITMGPKEHESQVLLLPLTKTGNDFMFAVKIIRGKVCHDSCPVAEKYWDTHLKNATKVIAQQRGYDDVEISDIRTGTIGKMRAYYELDRDRTADDADGPNVLWLI